MPDIGEPREEKIYDGKLLTITSEDPNKDVTVLRISPQDGTPTLINSKNEAHKTVTLFYSELKAQITNPSKKSATVLTDLVNYALIEHKFCRTDLDNIFYPIPNLHYIHPSQDLKPADTINKSFRGYSTTLTHIRNPLGQDLELIEPAITTLQTTITNINQLRRGSFTNIPTNLEHNPINLWFIETQFQSDIHNPRLTTNKHKATGSYFHHQHLLASFPNQQIVIPLTTEASYRSTMPSQRQQDMSSLTQLFIRLNNALYTYRG